MTEISWPQALVTVVGLCLAALPGYFAYKTVKRVEVKQDDNTAITQQTADVVAKSAEVVAKSDDKTSDLLNKVAEVHLLTNSTLTATKEALELSEQRNKTLEDIIGQFVSARGRKTKTGAVADLLATPPKAPPSKAVADQLIAVQTTKKRK